MPPPFWMDRRFAQNQFPILANMHTVFCLHYPYIVKTIQINTYMLLYITYVKY